MELDTTRNYVITIGRQFGSGGRELGRMIAERFGIEYYDKRLLIEAASRAGISQEMFENTDERVPGLLGSSVGFNMGYGQLPWYNGQAMMADSIYGSLMEAMEQLADTRPCVIVGRSADWVLRNHPVARVSLFVHAPIEARVKRIMGRSEKDKEAAARQLALKTDKLRAAYYNFYTDKKWGDAASYDLTFDSSLMPMEALCDLVALYIRNRFGIEPVRGKR
jgi:cytidylate kinase